MNILFLSRDFPPVEFNSGKGIYIIYLAKGLSRLGHYVYVLSQAPKRDFIVEEPFYKAIFIKNHNILYKGFRLFSRFFPFKEISDRYIFSALAQRKIEDWNRSFEIDLVESPEGGAEGYCFSLKKTLPLVVRLHSGIAVYQSIYRFKDSFQVRVARKMEEELINCADLITAPSKAVVDKLIELGMNFKKEPLIIPNAVDIETFKPPVENISPKEKLYILFFGQFTPLKGPQILLSALKILKEKKFDFSAKFIGRDTKLSPEPGFGSMVDYLKHFCSNHHLNQYVEFKPALPTQMLIPEIQQSDIVVIPSFWENCPLAVLEAMACGRAVVASKTGGIPEIIEDGVDGVLFEPNNYLDLAERLSYLHQNRGLISYLGQNALKKVEKFSPQKIATEMSKAYQKVL